MFVCANNKFLFCLFDSFILNFSLLFFIRFFLLGGGGGGGGGGNEVIRSRLLFFPSPFLIVLFSYYGCDYF